MQHASRCRSISPLTNHFGHSGARSFYLRPFASVTEMDRTMIDRWNAVVEPGDRDEVWHLGDFAVRQSAERVAFTAKNASWTQASYHRQQR